MCAWCGVPSFPGIAPGVAPRIVVFVFLNRENKVSTSTVAALFSKMALTGQRIAMVDMVLLGFSSISISTVGVEGARVSL